MGEAKTKDMKRREHARTIVNAFESHIQSIILRHENAVNGQKFYDMSRDVLIEVLVTPPPK